MSRTGPGRLKVEITKTLTDCVGEKVLLRCGDLVFDDPNNLQVVEPVQATSNPEVDRQIGDALKDGTVKTFAELDRRLSELTGLSESLCRVYLRKPRYDREGRWIPLGERRLEAEYWLFRNRVVLVTGSGPLSRAEVIVAVKHTVLRHEREYARMVSEIERFKRFTEATNTRRDPIPTDVQQFVWDRDRGCCRRCGNTEDLEFDHIIPIAKGGSNTERNIQLLCTACNRSKGAAIG